MTISFSLSIGEDKYEMVRELMAKTGKNRNEIISDAIANLYSDIIRKNIRERN
jgi:metal-responsive CopG/Arc/MetJ family transcriptional regulator